MSNRVNYKPDKDSVLYVPLGGSGHFGANLNLYGHDGKWIAIDVGMAFAGDKMPGIDILLPDPSFIEERQKDLAGVVITHGHEDHIGAMAYLWPAFQCPIYAGPFTSAYLREKFAEFDYEEDIPIIETPLNGKISIGPFEIEFASVAHSIPETTSIIVRTKAGNIVHSGDWNLDPEPVIGNPTNPEPFRKVGEEGVLAYVGDSTNAELPGRSGSETDVRKGLETVFSRQKGRIVVTAFSSNIGRMESVYHAAKACGRKVVLIGRSLKKFHDVAKSCGYLKNMNFLDENDLDHLKREQTVMLVTGSQGEYRAVLPRISRDDFSSVTLERGDSVIFSARPIPGNEKAISEIKNNLASLGVHIISETDVPIHVSGHPRRDEIADMLSWVRPKIVVPTHGERVHMEAQADLARECQVPFTYVPENGNVVRLTNDGPEKIGEAATGMLAVDRDRIIPVDHPTIRARKKAQFDGTAFITLVLDKKGRLIERPMIACPGVLASEDPDDAELLEELEDHIEKKARGLVKTGRSGEHEIAEEIRIAVRRFLFDALRMRPQCFVHTVMG